MNKEQNDRLETIRYFKGRLKDFKDFWDEQAGKNTNSYNTPTYQGFNDVHPTRGPKNSPHWKNDKK